VQILGKYPAFENVLGDRTVTIGIIDGRLGYGVPSVEKREEDGGSRSQEPQGSMGEVRNPQGKW
jgi:hypothetical protein